MPILAVEAALGAASAAVLDGERLLVQKRDEAGAAGLAALAAGVLEAAALRGRDLTAVAASVGPGSFTGIRTALALAAGIGLAAGIPVIGVSVGEALAAVLSDCPPRALWVAIDSRRGKIFLERDGEAQVFDLAHLPRPEGPLLLAGDAARAVAERLGAEGADVALAGICIPDAAAYAKAAARRLAGCLPPRPALPLYVDPPAARLPESRRPEPA